LEFRHSIKIASVETFALRASGGVSPNMALGSMPTRPALLVRLTDSDGCYGWGEVWANFPPRASLHKAHIIEDVITPKLIGESYTQPREVEQYLRRNLSVYFLHIGQCQVFEHIIAGLDTALWDLALRKDNQSFKAFMQIEDSSAATYASSININDLESLIPHHTKLGQRYFKVKIGFLADSDREMVETACSTLEPGARIMIDSNQSWDLQNAKEALQSLEPFKPFFAEESLAANAPLSHWEELAKATKIPLAGGENIYGVEQFLSMASAGLTVLQPDVAKWGGVTGALDLAAKLPAGTALWPHFMGTAVGQMAALSITAAINEGSMCEVDVNRNVLRTELCGNVTKIENGHINLPDSSGLLCEPEKEFLIKFADN